MMPIQVHCYPKNPAKPALTTKKVVAACGLPQQTAKRVPPVAARAPKQITITKMRITIMQTANLRAKIAHVVAHHHRAVPAQRARKRVTTVNAPLHAHAVHARHAVAKHLRKNKQLAYLPLCN